MNQDSMTAPGSAMLPPGVDAARMRDEVERIAVSPAFRSSKRTCQLLRHVVECALAGNIEDLKERRIGAEVFGRAADYDTNSDHIVRSVAGEVRRRLAQYYAQGGVDSEVRIELLAGSYVPQFRLARDVAPVALPIAHETAKPTSRAARWWIVAAAVVVAAIVLWTVRRDGGPMAEFWGPLDDSSSPVLLCVPSGGGPDGAEAVPPKTVIEFALAPARRIHINDAMVLAEVTGRLQAQGKAYRLLNRSNATSFRELQSGPFVLIGSLNNEWTLRLTREFRFSFERTADGARVVDRQNPANRSWRVDPNTPIEQMNRDYAIVSRFRDPKTEQTAVILAGIGPWGSLASGEFVTNPEYLKKILAVAPPDWAAKNLQVVISTDVIHGSSGPPNVVASHFW